MRPVTPTVLYTNMTSQCEELAMQSNSRRSNYVDNTCDGRGVILGAVFQRKVPTALFLKIPEFFQHNEG